jgi:hypothetical protein
LSKIESSSIHLLIVSCQRFHYIAVFRGLEVKRLCRLAQVLSMYPMHLEGYACREVTPGKQFSVCDSKSYAIWC